MNTKEPEGQTARWIEHLFSFDFEIRHLVRSIPMLMLLVGFGGEGESPANVLEQ